MDAEFASDFSPIADHLKRWETGDNEARDELFQHVCGRFQRLVHKMLQSFPAVRRWEETGDVAQNALIRLYKSLDQIETKSVEHFFALSTVMIRRELIDLARRYQGPQGLGANHATWQKDDESKVGQGPDAPDQTHAPNRLAQWCELHEQIAALPKEEQQVCDLLWYQGIPQGQAAEILEISERTLKRRWQAVRLKLHRLLGGGWT